MRRELKDAYIRLMFVLAVGLILAAMNLTFPEHPIEKAISNHIASNSR